MKTDLLPRAPMRIGRCFYHPDQESAGQIPAESLESIGVLLKALPDTFQKADNELWGLATVEIKDEEGDIIRVAGIRTDRHRPECPTKVLGMRHRTEPLPDGTHPIMGVVKEFRKTTTLVDGRSVPAFAFRMAYAQESDGSMTPYATRLKSVYDSGTMDSFSARFKPITVVPLKGGRYDVLECQLDREISACLLPQNVYTNVLRKAVDALGDYFDPMEYIEQRLIALQRARHNDVNTLVKAVNDRFDDFESSYIAASESSRDDRRPKTPQPEEVTKFMRALDDLMAKLK